MYPQDSCAALIVQLTWSMFCSDAILEV